MNTIKSKKIRVTLGVLLGFISILVIGFCILSWVILPSKKLTPMVVNMANEYLDADFQCEKIELTYFETFPYLGISLTEGRLISRVAQDSLVNEALTEKVDSLLSFKKCVISFQPTEYLFGGKIGINEISIDSPRIFGYVNSKGKTNWEIYAADSTATDSTTSSPPPPIDLKQISIHNGSITYYDSPKEMYTHVDGLFLNLKGALTQGANELNIEAGWKSFRYLSRDYSLENKLELHLNTKIKLSDNYNRIAFTDTELFINRFPFTLAGYLFNDAERNVLDMNLDYSLKVSDLNSLLAFVPSSYLKKDGELKAAGSVELSGNIRGELGDSIYPVVTACCILENGSLHGKEKDKGIDSLSLDVDLHLDMAHSDSSFIDLTRLFMKGKLSSFTMTAKATDLLKNPNVSAALKGDINFTELSKLLISPDTLHMNGNIKVDMETNFKANDLKQANYGKVYARGNLSIDNFNAFSKPFDIHMVINQAKLKMDSETQTEKFLNGQKVFSGQLSIDSLNVKWKQEVITILSNLNMALTAPPTTDTTAIVPIGGIIRFDHLRTLLPDSVWLWAGKTVIKGGINPSAANKKVAEAISIISVDSLAYIYSEYKSALLLTKSEFTMKAFPYQADTTRRKNRIESTLLRDSTRRRSIQFTRDTSMMLSGSSSGLLRKWDVKGNVVFNNLKAYTPLFPSHIEMQGTNVLFTTDNIKLSGAKLLLGKSDLTLSGEITNLRRVLLRGGKLMANLSVNSDYIDCNELMNTISSGMLYSEQQEIKQAPNAASDQFETFELATQNIATPPAESDTGGIFVLPSFLNLTLHTTAKKIDFDNLNLEKVSGEVILRNQSIQLTNLDMHSNIGCGTLTMIYTAKDKSKASTGFDLKMDEIQVNKLIDLFPPMDTLMPMLRSFEGIVDCRMAATCELDSTMSILLPTLYSACYLHGKNLVLMDGETFAEISKTLMFKNKKRNLIDNIAVDLVVKDNKIEVFPFLIEVDRYRVAVGGTHKLDMTFNYHISVLKSPVPFKLGIDVTGNPDNFKYKITKCKYKDIFQPAKSSAIDSTSLNIRKNIYEAIHKRIYTSLYDKTALPIDSILLTGHQHPDMANNEVLPPEEEEKLP